MPDETVIYYQHIEQDNLPAFEMEFKINCWIDPGQNGATTSLGVPLEPSYGPCLDDYQPVEAQFIYPNGRDGNWHNYDYFVDRWNIRSEIKIDRGKLFELCSSKAEQRRIDYELSQAGL
jgi:hypothetical protein